MVLDRASRLDLSQLAAEVEVPVERVVTLLEQLGIRSQPADRPRFSDEDASLLRAIDRAPAQWVQTHEVADLLRVIGRNMATAAEAAVAYHVRSVEPRAVELRDWVSANHEMAELSLVLGQHLGAVFRHHLRQAISFQRVSHAGLEQGEIVDLAVAFVDLTGFTGMSLDLDLMQLGDMVGRLDVMATDTAMAHHCRLVKLIGDEAMFVGPQPPQMVAAAWEFVDLMAGQGIDAHGAVTFGRAIMNHGDYFGPVINLAARLVDHAGPGELLCDAAVAAAAPARSVGPRDVRGLPQEVEVYRLTR